MVSFSDIAIFILATTRKNARHKQDHATYFESRIIPIRETWGQYFPSLYFTFGTNKLDFDFLHQQCRESSDGESGGSNGGDSGRGRRLLMRDMQVPPQNTTLLFTCPIYKIEAHYREKDTPTSFPIGQAIQNQPLLYEFNALWTGNCTGEYFGYGPTCRCQESMRIFNSHPTFQSKKWFIFMDDDIYYRPFSLAALLNEIATNAQNERAMALVASNRYRSFQFSKRGPAGQKITQSPPMSATDLLPRAREAPLLHNCRDSPAYNFPIAQPAIINR